MIAALLATVLTSAPVCVEPATVATSTAARLLTVTEREIYRLGERARASAERYRLLLDTCEADRGRLFDLALAGATKAEPERRMSWVWPVLGASLGAGGGAVLGDRVAGRPGALAGAAVLSGLAAALGVLLSEL